MLHIFVIVVTVQTNFQPQEKRT